MRILIIDEEFPYPLNTGKRIRSFNLAKELTRFHEVSYLAYGKEDSPSYDFLEENRITPFAVASHGRKKAGPAFYLRLLLNLLSPLPYIVSSHYTESFRRRLSTLLENGFFDLLLCEWTPYSIYIRNIRKIRKVIVAHNIETSIWKGYKQNEQNPLKKSYISGQLRKVAAFEKRCFKWADGATAVSEADADEIRKLGIDYRVRVIENGVDTDFFRPMNTDVDRNLLVFTGSLDWRPNQDAAIYFARSVFPILKRNIPAVKVAFVGRNPSRAVQSLKNQDIIVEGTVDDIRPYIARAGIYIVPLRIGSGSRLKILEAMAMQKAVVSTTKGAEGLNVSDGENILIGDGEKRFADSIISCYEDSDLRKRIAENGRTLVEKYYRWDILGEKLNKYLTSIVGPK